MALAPHSGPGYRLYLQSLDDKLLLRMARQHHCVVRMELALGSFVAEGSPLLSVAFEEEAGRQLLLVARQLHRAYVIGSQRTIEQDAGFGLRQIVDIALKALSPGINDTSTAVICIDHLGALLAYVGRRRFCNRLRASELKGRVLLIARHPVYADYFTTAFDQIQRSGEANVAVLLHLLTASKTILSRTPGPARRRCCASSAR